MPTRERNKLTDAVIARLRPRSREYAVWDKVGPRKVPLNARARKILARQPRGESPYVFPSPRDPSRPRGPELSLWYRARREAGIEDVRLHDLRHTCASHSHIPLVLLAIIGQRLTS